MSIHKRNFVVKCEGDSLVWNQYITKRKEKIVGCMVYYMLAVWKSGGDASPCPPPNCAHGSITSVDWSPGVTWSIAPDFALDWQDTYKEHFAINIPEST